MRFSIAKVTTLTAAAGLALFGAAGSAAAYGHHHPHVDHKHSTPASATIVTGGDATVKGDDEWVVVTGGDADVTGGNAIVTGGDAVVDNS